MGWLFRLARFESAARKRSAQTSLSPLGGRVESSLAGRFPVRLTFQVATPKQKVKAPIE